MYGGGLSLNGNVESEVAYCATPGASAFDTDANPIDCKGFERVRHYISVGANDEAVTAAVQEETTADGTYGALSPAVAFTLCDTGTASRLYYADVPVNERYQRVAVSSTPTADVEYSIISIKYNAATQPVSE